MSPYHDTQKCQTLLAGYGNKYSSSMSHQEIFWISPNFKRNGPLFSGMVMITVVCIILRVGTV